MNNPARKCEFAHVCALKTTRTGWGEKPKRTTDRCRIVLHESSRENRSDVRHDVSWDMFTTRPSIEQILADSSFHPGFWLFLSRRVSKGRGRWDHGRRGQDRSRDTHQRLLVERHVVLQPWSTGHLSLWIHPSNVHPDTWILRVLLVPTHRSHRIWHNMALLLLRPSTASDDNDDRPPTHDNHQHDYKHCQSGSQFRDHAYACELCRHDKRRRWERKHEDRGSCDRIEATGQPERIVYERT